MITIQAGWGIPVRWSLVDSNTPSRDYSKLLRMCEAQHRLRRTHVRPSRYAVRSSGSKPEFRHPAKGVIYATMMVSIQNLIGVDGMFSMAIPVWEILLRTTLVYVLILIGLRLAGKREIGQMTIFDLVVLLLLANAVQNAMVGADTSLIGGTLAVLMLLVLNSLVAQLRLRWPRLRRIIEGSPTLLVLHGEVLTSHLRHEGIDQETLETALREHGIKEVSEVEMAVLEIDGSISIVPVATDHHAVKRITKPLQKM
jgi:uncharacterized membrane protein YcaP (DUF421 family)